MLRVEADWPEGQRASRAQLRSRLERFPEGVFLAVLEGEVVGVTTSCLLRYEPGEIERDFKSWDAVTNRGYLWERDRVAGANALYVVSTGVLRAHSGCGAALRLLDAQVDLSVRLGLAYCATGAILARYADYARSHPGVSAREYAWTRRGPAFVDPLLEGLRRRGFRLPDDRHVLPGYYASEAARDWSALMVMEHAPGRLQRM